MKTTQFKSAVSFIEDELTLADVLKAFEFPEGTRVFLRAPNNKTSLELGKDIKVLYAQRPQDKQKRKEVLL